MDTGVGSITGGITQNMTGNAVQSAEQSSDDTFAKKLEEAARKNDDKALKQACQEFESIMLSILYKQMKATVIKSDLMEKDPGTEIFQSMQDDELMKQASKTGSFGLAESLYKQLSRQYGKAAYTGAADNAVKSSKAADNVAESSGDAVIIQESGPVSEEDGK